MFFTEPKFVNIANPRKLLSLLQDFELKFRPESPITQKAMESLGHDHQHFRRKNKFEMRYDFEIQKLPYTETDLHKAYLRYLGELINDYQILFEQRKRIKLEFERRQREEDELRGYKWPDPQPIRKPIRQNVEVLTLEQKLKLIEEERNKEQRINDCFAKEAIKLELERRRKLLESEEKEQKTQATRKKMFEKMRGKAIEENKKVSKKLQHHRQNISEQLESDFRKSKSFQEKMEAKEANIQQLRAKQVSEIANRNRKLEDKINQLRDDFGNRLMEELVKKQQALELSMGKRQKTAEQMEKNRLEKQQFFEQKLNNINNKIKQERELKESELYNKVGYKLLKSEKLIEEHEKLIQSLQTSKRKEIDQRFTRQRRRYKESEDKQNEKMEEWGQKLKSIQERVEQFQIKKSEELHSLKEQKLQGEKEHQEYIQQFKRRGKDKEQKRYLEKCFSSQNKLKQLKIEQEQVRSYQTVSKQKFEQSSLAQMGELVNLKYSSSAQLLNKLKDLEDEETFTEIQLKYKQIVKIPEKKPPE